MTNIFVTVFRRNSIVSGWELELANTPEQIMALTFAFCFGRRLVNVESNFLIFSVFCLYSLHYVSIPLFSVALVAALQGYCRIRSCALCVMFS